MTSRRLLILSIAALIAIAAGVWIAGRQGASNGGQASALYPDLMQQLDDLQAVRFYKAGDERALELTHGDRGWTVSERANYPADEAKLGEFLRNLASAKIFEEKTSNAENYTSLGVEDVSDPAASGVRVEVSGASSPVNLVVGNPGPGGQSQYVRRVDEPQSWLVDKRIDATATPAAWLDKEIIDVSADRVQAARVIASGEKPYTAAKDSRAATNFLVEGLPKGKELSSPSVANGFASALAGLTLTDVQPANAFDDAKPAASTTISTFDGLVVELDGWTRDDKHFVALKTAFDPARADRFKLPTAPAEDPEGAPEADAQETETANSSKSDAGGPATPDVSAQAQSVNERVTDWVYEIPSYKYEQIFKPLEDLL